MILGGMGSINPLITTGAKIFASGYALFSGLVFIAVMGDCAGSYNASDAAHFSCR